jgi:AraC family transcriptional regulator
MSGFRDPSLVRLLECLRAEADRSDASKLYVRGISQAIAIHLCRHYVDIDPHNNKAASPIPLFKLRRIHAWMAEHMDQEFSLALLAEQAGMSEFHFNRLFKRAVGIPPYSITLR